jgi:hypothetical protein
MDELLEARKLWDSERFQRIALADSVPEQNPSEDDIRYAIKILGVERAILDSDDIFFVEPDMHRLVLAAMESFEPEPLLSTDLIVPQGYVRLPEPIEVPGVKDSPDGFSPRNPEGEETYLARHSAFGWKRLPLGDETGLSRVQGEGIMLTYFHTREDVEDSIFPALYPGRYIGWPLADTVEAEDRVQISWHPAYLYPRVFFRLVMQRLTEVSVLEGPPRAIRRRHERAGYKVPRYSVVRLRRPKRAPGSHADEREAKWRLNYRTVTRGHWRQQWYPSLSAHRQIWIDEFIRGPEDAELVIKPRVFDVRD